MVYGKMIQRFKGFCQVKKKKKIREKLGLARPHQPTPLAIYFIFWGNMFNKKKHHKKTQKNTKFPPKKIIRVGA